MAPVKSVLVGALLATSGLTAPVTAPERWACCVNHEYPVGNPCHVSTNPLIGAPVPIDDSPQPEPNSFSTLTLSFGTPCPAGHMCTQAAPLSRSFGTPCPAGHMCTQAAPLKLSDLTAKQRTELLDDIIASKPNKLMSMSRCPIPHHRDEHSKCDEGGAALVGSEFQIELERLATEVLMDYYGYRVRYEIRRNPPKSLKGLNHCKRDHEGGESVFCEPGRLYPDSEYFDELERLAKKKIAEDAAKGKVLKLAKRQKPTNVADGVVRAMGDDVNKHPLMKAFCVPFNMFKAYWHL